MILLTAEVANVAGCREYLFPSCHKMSMWQWYLDNREAVQPVLAPLATLLGSITTLAVGVFLAFAALRLARTATAQAEIASKRHIEQTLADKQRRITESFAKATEQLGSDRIEARLGGIYTLERISKESADDYSTVMETLTAFVRERAQWKKEAEVAGPSVPHGKATDIAAVLTVIARRDGARHRQEVDRIDLSGANLEQANLSNADLSKANLSGTIMSNADLSKANLSGAILSNADLSNADLHDANLSDAILSNADLFDADLSNADLSDAGLSDANLSDAILARANLSDANLFNANLRGTDLSNANLGDAILAQANLSNADLSNANLSGAVLSNVRDLTQTQLDSAYGTDTKLPDGLTIKAGKAGDESRHPD